MKITGKIAESTIGDKFLQVLAEGVMVGAVWPPAKQPPCLRVEHSPWCVVITHGRVRSYLSASKESALAIMKGWISLNRRELEKL